MKCAKWPSLSDFMENQPQKSWSVEQEVTVVVGVVIVVEVERVEDDVVAVDVEVEEVVIEVEEVEVDEVTLYVASIVIPLVAAQETAITATNIIENANT